MRSKLKLLFKIFYGIELDSLKLKWKGMDLDFARAMVVFLLYAYNAKFDVHNSIHS